MLYFTCKEAKVYTVNVYVLTAVVPQVSSNIILRTGTCVTYRKGVQVHGVLIHDNRQAATRPEKRTH